MDIMIILQVIVLLGAIFIGIRLGGIAIGYAGGLGVVILGLVLGMKPGNIPWDVILIIAAAIAAISAMQQAGGLDYMVRVTEKILRSSPKFINYLAPACGWLLTILAGTGNAVFSLMPVVVDVAKSQNIKPSVPLSLHGCFFANWNHCFSCECSCGLYERRFRATWMELSNFNWNLDQYNFYSLYAYSFYSEFNHSYGFKQR